MSANNVGLNAGVPNLAPWPGMVVTADLTAEATTRANADTALQASINTLSTLKQPDAAADVANNLLAVVTPIWTIAVTAGLIYSLTGRIFVDSAANAGGVVIVIQRPNSTIQGHSKGTTANATTVTEAYFGEAVAVATDKLFTAYVSFATTAGFAQGFIEFNFQIAPTANGNVVIGFHPGTNLQNMIVKQGSTLQVAHS